MDKYKITDSELESGVVAAPNILNDTPQENKSVFDRLPRLIATKVNGFIDAVISKFADYYNKTEIDGKENVLNEAINTKANDAEVYKKTETYSKSETEQKINEKVTELGAGDMAKAVYDTDGDGVVDKAENADNAENAETSQNVRGYWLSKTDANGNPTDELYAHWYEDSETGEIIGGKAEEGNNAKDAVLYVPQQLTEEQKAVARENIGVDETNNYELIESITLTEEVTEIIRSNFQPCKMFMVLTTYPANTKGYMYSHIGHTFGVTSVGVSVNSGDTEYATRMIFRQEGGVWDCYGYKGMAGSTSETIGQTAVNKLYTIANFPSISYLRFFVSSGVIPVGTKIDIWGVRA